MIVQDFDTSKFYLGRLCKNSHAWGNSTNTLRYIGSSDCVVCCSDRSRHHREENREYILQQKKEYRIKNIEAVKARDKRYRESNLEKCKLKQKEWRDRNKDRIRSNREKYTSSNKAYIAQWQKSYRERNKERLREAKKEYRIKNLEQIKQHKQKYYQSPDGKLTTKRAVMARRARKSSVHHAPWTQRQWNSRVQDFNSCCAYCSKANLELTIDHFIPLAQGGENALGNVVPACLSCNCSKQSKDPYEWYSQQGFYRKSEWQKILSVLGRKTNYRQGALF